ncbi:aminopeptidase P family protein [Aestuariibacter halophilus]|uniref:Aminopeptidase P family protein n=1 Tax=Fluctibacter halophilus TaxID=226011 RepID=A0ABS8G926_9ALTE|nr:M24 family metallopeptidase [Aestuariibacter halophilus]MCC2616209.1 aminopeptidase P family protein [Aestuariibacter halophilus]
MAKHKLLLSLAIIATCFFSPLASASQDFKGPSPWPEIRKARINQLLPAAMTRAGMDAWLVICRENNNDPLAAHVGCENAGQTAVFLFYRKDSAFHTVAFSPLGEAKALSEQGLLQQVIPVERSGSAIEQAAAFIKPLDLGSIAINTSPTNAQADGLSHTQYQALTQALGPLMSNRLTSATDLVFHWLSVKLPEEVAIMRQAAALTAQWQIEAYQQVIPGVTTDADVARFLKQKMAQAGVSDAWAPDQNPNVNSGADRGHAHPTNKIIQPGDVIQTDFGIRVFDRWVTDIQRFAYVLKPGETQPPEHIANYWTQAKRGREAAFDAMKPGVRGIDVDAAQRAVLASNGSIPVMWSTGHPVGYEAHDTGPNLGGARAVSVRPAATKQLATGMTFAFDGFYSWHLDDGQTKTISVEEMVVINDTGAEYLIPPQQALVLIRAD